MKKKIAIILHGLSPNGVETMFAQLSALWDREKFELYYFLAVDPGAEQYYEEQVVQNGCHVVHLHDLNGGRKLQWARTLRRALAEYGPFDAVHSNLSLLSGLNLRISRKEGVPVRIAHVHTFPRKSDSLARRLYQSGMRPLIAINATDRLACSEEAGKEAYGKSSFQVIENGIMLKDFLAAGEQKPDRDGKQGRPRFVTVGRISEDKNPGFLLEVFCFVHKMLPGASLTWVGDGPQRRSIENRAAELELQDAVFLTGVRENVPEILAQCDYFLFPSLHEGFGNALIEAQAAGLDCFASDAVPKSTDCGKIRFLSLGQTAEEWAEEIAEHIDSGKHMQLDRNRIERFDINRMAQRLMQLYDQ